MRLALARYSPQCETSISSTILLMPLALHVTCRRIHETNTYLHVCLRPWHCGIRLSKHLVFNQKSSSTNFDRNKMAAHYACSGTLRRALTAKCAPISFVSTLERKHKSVIICRRSLGEDTVSLYLPDTFVHLFNYPGHFSTLTRS